MKKNLIVVSAILLGCVVALQAGSNGKAVSASATVAARHNTIAQGFPLSLVDRGVKQFHVYNEASAQLVVDEAGVAPVAGTVVSIEVSSGADCYAMVFDSAAASGLDVTSYSKMITVPIFGVSTGEKVQEFKYPKQFNRGLVILLSEAATTCRATVGWKPN